jgi:uncharacterized repeat protein (TIGR01451 family)
MKTSSSRLSALAPTLAALIVGALAPASASAAPAPAWNVLQSSRPTDLVPGTHSTGFNPEYELFVRNVGGEAAPGTVVTDVLPAGLTPVNAEAQFGFSGAKAVERLACPIAGQTVTCALAEPVAPGDAFKVRIGVSVAESAAASVVNEATVEGGGAVATSRLATTIGHTLPQFEILPGRGLELSGTDERGDPAPAGSHPFVTTINVGIPGVDDGIESWEPAERPRNISVELPQGFVVDPMATATKCSQQILSHSATTNPNVHCPQSSQVGLAYPVLPGAFQHAIEPLYNMVPPPGVPAALAFEIEGTVVEILGGVDGGFHLTAKSTDIISRFKFSEVALSLWGVPSDGRHDHQRAGGTEGGPDACPRAGCAIAPSPAPFVTMPTSCTGSTDAHVEILSWLGHTAEATRPMTDREGDPAPITGCDQLAFAPTIESRPTTNAAETASGLDFTIHQPQDESLEGRSTAPLKDATVTLPEGLTVNPSAANGLAACTEAQMGYAPEEGMIRFSTAPQSCPDAAKVGTMKVKTPLLEDELPGSIYLAKPFDNPFGSLVALYLAVEDEETGIVAKLAGKAVPDPRTGQLSATFTENPELPLEDISLHFFEGPGGALTTPLACGTHTTASTLTPWSTPEGIDAHPSASFETTAGCHPSEADAPKAYAFAAGTESPLSGAYSPFVLRLSRPDGSQHVTGIDTTLPEGLLGSLAGVAYCPEAGIARAISREHPEEGKLEQEQPSCPASSEVGTVRVTAGSGIAPIAVSGHAYLAGPYKGAPLSLAVIVPAVAGPFDLGAVVDRVALNVGEYDARIHAVADPLPTIREGIPLDVRSIELRLGRPGFTLNPTSCEAKAIEGSVSTQAGQSAGLNNRFQVGECGRLAFEPALKLAFTGQTGRLGNPAVKAVLTQPKGEDANVAGATVILPKGMFIDQAHVSNPCTRVQFNSTPTPGEACPAKSVLGSAKVWTPLLEAPEEGPVYFRSNGGERELPDLVVALRGQIPLQLVGFVDSVGRKGAEVRRVRSRFLGLPDAPVSRFELRLAGGKKGLLENSKALCKLDRRAKLQLAGQNGKAYDTEPKVQVKCPGPKKHKGGKGKGRGKKGGKGNHGKHKGRAKH